MNERIQALIEQATISRVITGPEVFTTPPIYFDKVKFAELIVQECMMLCGAVHGASEHIRGKNDAFGLGAEKCKVMIKKHFVVEESFTKGEIK